MPKRQLPKILICDQIEIVGLELLKNHAEVVEKIGINQKDLAEIIGDFDAIIVRRATPLPAEILNQAKRLRVIGRSGAGLNGIDVLTASKHGIRVVNAPEVNVISVAELIMGMMLTLARNIYTANAGMKDGQWLKQELPGIRLSGKTLGLVGFDAIARQVAIRAEAFGMHVLVATKLANVELNQMPNIVQVELNSLLQQSDFVSLHENIKDDAGVLIGENELLMMRPTAYLINCANAGYIDSTEAIKKLDEGALAGIGLDSFAHEPAEDFSLAKHPNVIATPSIAAGTEEARQEASISVAEQVVDILEHNEPNGVLPLMVVPLDKIMPHESIDQKRVDRLKSRLQEAGQLANPPIVTPLEDRYMVLDGATRTAALKQLGYPHAVVQITTEEEGLDLHTWFHVIQKIDSAALKHLLEGLTGISLEPVEAGQAADRMFEYGALCYIHFGNGDAYLIQPEVGVNRLDALNLLTETYIEASFVDRTLENDIARLKSDYPDITALVVFPEYTVGQVMQVTLGGRYFPAGITRFIIPGRILRINADLEILKSEKMSLNEKNRWLRRHLEDKVQGNHVRFYRESVYLLDE
ncbi:MAG: phosphoglycerate dehydrogenase-like enzyme [Cellvibrionaceae bacterium]|jgi:phosphoglycerate dehydrogenase-like enzyme